jgi:hypothetical protein
MEPLSAQEDPIQAAETRLSAPGPLGGLQGERGVASRHRRKHPRSASVVATMRH